MKKSLSLVVTLCALGVLAGCGAGTPPPPPPVATHFSVTATATATAGTAFNVIVSALDDSNSVVASYSGMVHFTSSDNQAVLPHDSPLTNGTGTFSVTFKTAVGQTIVATDSVKTFLTGASSPIAVSAGAATQLNVSVPNAAATAAMPFNFTVTAFDAFNNLATSYSGLVHISCTDGQAKLPTDAMLAGGTQVFTITLNTVGNGTIITAKDTTTTSIAGSSTINVFSNAATHLLVVPPGNAATRAPISVQVKALDGADNIAAGYSGKVHFTSSDPNAILPADAPLPMGVGSFSVTLENAGSQTIMVADTVAGSLSKTSDPIVVSKTPDPAISPAAPPSGTVGVNYGQSKTETFECFRGRGGSVVCNPCTTSLCASLPLCNRNFSVLPCRETRQVFAGFTFTAIGGIPPYSWSASGMPPLLSVNATNGEITGTPTLAGTYTVAIKLVDSGTPPVTMPGNFSIVIKNPPPPVINTTPAPPAGAVNLLYSFTFTASSTAMPLAWRISLGTPPVPLALNPDGVLSGTPTAAGTSSITLIAEDSFKQDSAPQEFKIQIFAHGFAPTGSMGAARASATATLLSTGMVLVAGGTDANDVPVATAELYDPTKGTFSPTGSMGTARAHFAATLLCDLSSLPCTDKRVLVTGGLDTNGNPLTTAELYDPTAGTFSATSDGMQFVHASHTATLLKTGKVLVAGWGNATAELFDPATGIFAQTGSMAMARVSHTATLLSNGKVLLTGGVQGTGATLKVLAEAELYDPSNGSFLPTLGSMATARQSHTASLLTDGKVLVTGGMDNNAGHAVATAELFDPTTQLFTATKGSMETARAFQTATVLKDGTVLVTGGDSGTGPLATAEVYDPTAGTFSPTGDMETPRESHTATLLPTGKVLVTGGTSSAALATAELYQ
jgi:hypothetical protein